MSASITAADAAACSSRSFDVQLLAGRVEACAEQVHAVQARLAQLQLMDWQSPAGLAYRSDLRGAGRCAPQAPGKELNGRFPRPAPALRTRRRVRTPRNRRLLMAQDNAGRKRRAAPSLRTGLQRCPLGAGRNRRYFLPARGA